MDAAFWHQRWDQNQIAFHEGTPNKLLVQHLDALALPPGARVFLPLCGKTQDIGWLLNQGYQVAGAELSASAVEQLFAELGRTPVITTKGEMQHRRRSRHLRGRHFRTDRPSAWRSRCHL